MRGARDSEAAAEIAVHDLEGRAQPLGGDRARDLGERQMGGDERHAQGGVLQHHHGQGGAGSRREVLGVSREIEARFDERALLYRCRHHGGELAAQAAVASPIEHGDDGGGVARVELPGHHRMRCRHIEELERTGSRDRGSGRGVVSRDERCGARGRRRLREKPRVAGDHQVGRPVRPCERDAGVRPDTRRLTRGDDDARDAHYILISTNASSRSRRSQSSVSSSALLSRIAANAF